MDGLMADSRDGLANGCKSLSSFCGLMVSMSRTLNLAGPCTNQSDGVRDHNHLLYGCICMERQCKRRALLYNWSLKRAMNCLLLLLILSIYMICSLHDSISVGIPAIWMNHRSWLAYSRNYWQQHSISTSTRCHLNIPFCRRKGSIHYSKRPYICLSHGSWFYGSRQSGILSPSSLMDPPKISQNYVSQSVIYFHHT